MLVSIVSGVVTLLGAGFTIFLAFHLARVTDRYEDMRRTRDRLNHLICQSRHELTVQVVHLRAKVGDRDGEVGAILDEMDRTVDHLQCDV